MDFTDITEHILQSHSGVTKDDIWSSSLFERIKVSSTCEKGRFGEKIIKHYHTLSQDVIENRTSIQHDIIINGSKVEVKLSCMNKSGYFKWLQIRADDYFDTLYLVSVFPNEVRIFNIPKKDLMILISENHVKSQHGGKRNINYSIKYLGIKANAMPDWFTKFEIILKNNI